MIVEQDHTLTLLENQGWDERIEIVEVGGFVRSHIIYARDLTVVYDTLLGPRSGSWLLHRVQERAPGKPIVAVISHSDWDHCWGNQCFVGKATMLASELCARRLEGAIAVQELAQKRSEHSSYQDVVVVPPQLRIRGEATLQGGDLTFELLATPGHRPDHLAIYVPEIATLFPGDAVETPFALLDEHDPAGDLDAMESSLERFLQLPVKWLLCNHAPPQRGLALVESNRAYYRELRQMAGQAASLEDLLERFPYRGPAEEEFYRKDHGRIVAAAWGARLALGSSISPE